MYWLDRSPTRSRKNSCTVTVSNLSDKAEPYLATRGEGWPATTQVGSELRVMINLSPSSRLRGISMSPRRSLGFQRAVFLAWSARRSSREVHCQRIYSARPRMSGRVASIASWLRIPATCLPSSDYRFSYQFMIPHTKPESSLATAVTAMRRFPRLKHSR